MISRFHLLVCLLLSVALISCTENNDVVMPGLSADELAVLRWEALIERDFEAAYEFETPAFRSTYSAGLFSAQYSGILDWKEIKLIGSEEISSEQITVQLELTFLLNEGEVFEQLIPSSISESWLLVDDQWWHVSDF